MKGLMSIYLMRYMLYKSVGSEHFSGIGREEAGPLQQLGSKHLYIAIILYYAWYSQYSTVSLSIPATTPLCPLYLPLYTYVWSTRNGI